MFEMTHESGLDFVRVLKIVRREHVALHMRKNDLNLIQPGGVDRQPVNLDPEWQAEALDPLFDLLGRMGRAVIQDQMQNSDLLAPEAAEEHLEEGLEFFAESFSIKAAGQGFTRMNQKRGEQLDGPFALVAVAHQTGTSGSRGTSAAGGLAGLDGCLFIRADHDVSVGRQLLGPFVKPQDRDGLFKEPGISRFLPASELPRLDVIGAQPATNGGGRDA